MRSIAALVVMTALSTPVAAEGSELNLSIEQIKEQAVAADRTLHPMVQLPEEDRRTEALPVDLSDEAPGARQFALKPSDPYRDRTDPKDPRPEVWEFTSIPAAIDPREWVEDIVRPGR